MHRVWAVNCVSSVSTKIPASPILLYFWLCFPSARLLPCVHRRRARRASRDSADLNARGKACTKDVKSQNRISFCLASSGRRGSSSKRVASEEWRGGPPEGGVFCNKVRTFAARIPWRMHVAWGYRCVSRSRRKVEVEGRRTVSFSLHSAQLSSVF